MAALHQTPLLILSLLPFLLQAHLSHSLSCSSPNLSKSRVYHHCTHLPRLNARLHWSFDAATSSLHFAFAAPPAKPGGWVAWGINPNGTGMVGAQALVALQGTDGTVSAKTFNLVSYKTIKPMRIAYEVSGVEAEYESGEMRISAAVAVPEGVMGLNQVWQVGSAVVDGMPAVHEFQAANLNAKGRLDLVNGRSTGNDGGTGSSLGDRNIHGILNSVSWGIMFPIGIMMARYVRAFTYAEPAWFYLHVGCQFSSYAVGVAGWATGLRLGSQSHGVEYTSHRDIGIALFCLATLQVFALFLRPKKDHKYRQYWNMYHHGVGYGVVVLGIINVFKGLQILDPPNKWKTAYITFLGGLGGIALLLEISAWIVVWKHKSSTSAKPYDGVANGSSNGRQQPLNS